jgi:hypothetical protein
VESTDNNIMDFSMIEESVIMDSAMTKKLAKEAHAVRFTL